MSRFEKLFEMFPPVSTEEWMEKVRADLKGGDFSKKLVWEPFGNKGIMPFYREEDLEGLISKDTVPGEFPYIRGKRIKDNSWRIRQDLIVSDYSEANRKALNILMKGVDSLGFIITDHDTINESNFESLLKGIIPAAVELNFFSNGKAKEISKIFKAWLENKAAGPASVTGAIEADPLGRLTLNGTLCIPAEKGFDYLFELAESLKGLPSYRAVHLNASLFGNGGADIVSELGYGIAMGAEYISQLTQRGMEAAEAASKIRFSFGTGSLYFPEIAKLRAARLLWSAVMNGFAPGNLNAAKMDIHCSTTRWNKTIYDPYINLLRTQTEVMASALGGADSITAEPFDVVFRNPDEFSERIARNQQLILKEEAYFDRVSDPGAGSYYIENLTHLIAEQAWTLFVELEKEGGYLEALKKGLVQEKIKKSADQKKSEVSNRKTILLGTNLYPGQDKVLPETGTADASSGIPVPGENMVEPVQLFRGAEVFERIRMAVDNSGKTPEVFLLTIGDRMMRKARAGFSSDFFSCAGYRVINNPGFNSVDEGIESALRSEAGIVVVCSSDNEYADYGPKIFNRLKDKTIVVIAGNPACIDELKAAGIEHFISIRSDVAAALMAFSQMLGIKILS